ncbi:MAG: hypothetical protein QOI24_2918 [Acidobacteriota bacterium]|jgi:glycosyltransferase involved in cell wall biosynthesis|nr:hypothetical protein [Acidobacteriota bacterium]
MESRPLVTVGMPLYNAASRLERSLSLIRTQTWENLEIILCDNASTDETPDICQTAAREDARIRYVRHPQNLGPIANFNAVMRLKRGEFFTWAAHDDEKSPEFVEQTLRAMQCNPNAAMSCAHTVLVTPEGERVHEPYSAGISSPRLNERAAAFVRDTQVGIAFYGLFRSSVLDAIGEVDPWLDTDRRYLFKAIVRGPFEVVPKPLFRFRLFHTLDDYVEMGFAMRPGAADFDLDLYRHLPELMRKAGIDGDELRDATAALHGALRPYLDNRATWLISRALAGDRRRERRLRDLFAWARQYPPLFGRRIFWGAVRRVVVGS